MNLANKNVVITGGSIGIGLELAKQMLAEGAKVLVCARNMPALEQAKKHHPSLHIVQCDITDKSQVEHLLRESKQTLGGIDVLVNNAAVFRRFKILSDYSLAQQFEEIEINLKGVIQVTNIFLPEILKSQEGVIVNLTSPAGFVTMAASPIYSATKAAIDSYTTSLRFQLKSKNVKVVLLYPTATDTRMNKNNPGIEAQNLMSTEKFVGLALKGLKKGKDVIYAPPIGMFKIISRIAPKMAFNMINKDVK